ncbi:MAG TPA: alpha/beta hydrolase, partial [Prolixibacteraceae bacterium]|nr:alpha/beta hydrolase [Prolixibacteraceae bacterium]
GNEPPGVSSGRVAETHPTRVDWMDQILIRPQVERSKLIKIGPYTSMGDHLPGYLYCPLPADSNKKVPVVIFLHQYAHAHGFTLGYSSNNCEYNTELFQSLVDSGFAVLAIDMLGFGTRIEEGSLFYERYPEWSKMGKMVADVRVCVDAMRTFDFIDPDKIFILGNSIGGTVALLSASLDQRVAGIAVVSGFTPLRKNTYPSEIKILCHLHGFIPKLGLWADDPESAPVDFLEILAGIAPRPLMVIAPEFDRHANRDAVEQTISSVAEVYSIYGQKENLQFETPMEINRLTNDMREDIIHFFQKIIKKE